MLKTAQRTISSQALEGFIIPIQSILDRVTNLETFRQFTAS